MKLSYYPFELQLRHTFTIATYSRSSTPLVMVEFELDGEIGYGEASLPPYLGETQADVMAFLQKVDLSVVIFPFEIENIMKEVDAIASGHTAAKAAIDLALHDLDGKLRSIPCWKAMGVDPEKMPLNCLTIGMDNKAVLQQKVNEAAEFKVLKIKLGSEDDRGIIRAIREVSDLPLYVDANQGWRDPLEAIDLIHWLAAQGVVLIEQPVPKQQLDDLARLTEASPLPIIADESFQRLEDLERLRGACTGVNIKLMKCAGLWEARQIIRQAREWDMSVMLGCMTETTCAIMGAAQIAPLCDWLDLDGPWLVSNNPFETPVLEAGKISLCNEPGFGLRKKLVV